MIKDSDFVVFVPGVWDLFHIGHVDYLKRASIFADRLIVGVDTDESVKKTKGRYPMIPFEQRAKIVEACRYVDEIVGHENARIDIEQLKELDVDILVLGGNWCGKAMPGLSEAIKFLTVIYFPYTEGISSTEIRKKLRRADE